MLCHKVCIQLAVTGLSLPIEPSWPNQENVKILLQVHSASWGKVVGLKTPRGGLSPAKPCPRIQVVRYSFVGRRRTRCCIALYAL